MKKKLGLILLLLITAISIFTLSACGGSDNDTDDDTSECRHRDKDDDGVCDKCDEPTHTHNYSSWIEEVPATCTNDGTKGHYTCSDCNKKFDANKNELSDLVIASQGHNIVNDACTKCDFEMVYSEGLEFELVNNEYYKVVGIGTCQDAELYIPKTYSNLPVKEIGESAFESCSSLTNVISPDSVTSMGDYAFWCCEQLTSVTIGNGVEIITDATFAGCSSLTNVIIPDSVTSLGDYAFRDCKKLTSVTIGNGVTSIGFDTFYGCDSLTSITFEDTSTWYRTENESDWNNKTNGTETDFSSPETNANYLKSTYESYCWYKK